MKQISKAYRTFLFKKRMIEIISIMVGTEYHKCFFCGKPFKPSDFPIEGRDKVDIHHVSYSPEWKVLAHHKCHLTWHSDQKKSGKKQKS